MRVREGSAIPMKEGESALAAGASGGLSLINVVKRYRDVVAVDRLSLDVQMGEFLALLGPSGAGKSTLLRLIAGLEHCDAGDIHLVGKSVAHVRAYNRDIGLVFQHYALFPHMSVAENVGFPLKMRRVSHDEAARRIQDILGLVRLEKLSHRRPAELSGGQQQRVALARALVFRPSLLLMDEPLAALDKKLREQLRVEIRAIQRRLGVTVVYVTHDQEEALSLSDRVAVMHSGRIEQVGPPRLLYDQPASIFVAGFVGEGNFFDGEIIESAGSTVIVLSRGFRLRAFARPDHRWRVSDNVVCLVRPERMILCDEGDRPPNLLKGQVEDVSYLGQATTYRIRARDGHPVKVVVPERGGARGLNVGDACLVGWDPEDSVLLPGESEATIGEIAGLPSDSPGAEV